MDVLAELLQPPRRVCRLVLPKHCLALAPLLSHRPTPWCADTVCLRTPRSWCRVYWWLRRGPLLLLFRCHDVLTVNTERRWRPETRAALVSAPAAETHLVGPLSWLRLRSGQCSSPTCRSRRSRDRPGRHAPRPSCPSPRHRPASSVSRWRTVCCSGCQLALAWPAR